MQKLHSPTPSQLHTIVRLCKPDDISLRCRRPRRDTHSVGDSGSSQDTRMDPKVVQTVAVLERRLHKATTANSKWKEKYSIEAKVSAAVCVGLFCDGMHGSGR